MTEGPPPSEATPSAANISSKAPVPPQTSETASTLTSSNHPPSSSWPYNNSGLPNYYTHTNPYLTAYAPYPPYHSYPPIPTTTNADSQPLKARDNVIQTSNGTPPLPPTTPLPDPKTYKHWEEALNSFFQRMKMFQSLKGLENDFLVLNSDWEQKNLPGALAELIHHLKSISARMVQSSVILDQSVAGTNPEDTDIQTNQLDERKLHNVHLVPGKSAQSPSNITKSISQFIARSRSRNNASNRNEFLQTLFERKRKISEDGTKDDSSIQAALVHVHEPASCARADARTIDRDKQMKYDIAKNEDGPLVRRAKGGGALEGTSDLGTGSAAATTSAGSSSALDPVPVPLPLPQSESESQPRKRRKLTTVEGDEVKADKAESSTPTTTPMDVDEDDLGQLAEERVVARLPGINARVRNLEEHLAVRYVPAPPHTISARIKYLEDHLVKLEKEYPPWAALHFNQPKRGWPPPPRATPLIVPPHLRSQSNHLDSSHSREVSSNVPGALHNSLQGSSSSTSTTLTKGKGPGKARTSTLHKAVMDRLEVQKAMEEMKPDPG